MEQEQVAEKEEAVEVEVADPSIKKQKEQEVEVEKKLSVSHRNFLKKTNNSSKEWTVLIKVIYQSMARD